MSVRILKKDVVTWFSKWAGITIDYHAIDDTQCDVIFVSENNDGAHSWLMTGETIKVQIVGVSGSRVKLRIDIPGQTGLESVISLVFCGSLLLKLCDCLAYVGRAENGGKWSGQGLFEFRGGEGWWLPYETALANIIPKKIIFDGDDVVVDG